MRGRGDEGNVAGCPSAQRESSQRYGTWDSHTPSYLCPPRADTSNAPAAYKYSELRGCRGRCRTGGGHPQRRTTVVSERPSSDVALLLGVLPLARAERLGPLGAALRPALKQGVDLLQSFPFGLGDHKPGVDHRHGRDEGEEEKGAAVADELGHGVEDERHHAAGQAVQRPPDADGGSPDAQWEDLREVDTREGAPADAEEGHEGAQAARREHGDDRLERERKGQHAEPDRDADRGNEQQGAAPCPVHAQQSHGDKESL
mmetsp:Transcript_45703/g.116939  ORF Transcript_45703/g.116939 Transcript_45703/m.116939 type:complete len:259 (-) Transcript_45703:1286-2062(-)